ncbi:MAG: precorrin-8X methylmutase [Firmicutes bacterium]|nr:precorrin-8X methylmutase [Bacillota bacterium]
MSTGFIVLGHGSKVSETVQILKSITGSLRRRLAAGKVQYAALQFNEPDLPAAIAKMKEDGVRDIVVLPLFLTDGNHVREDIPEIIKKESARHPSMNIRLADHIGADVRITDILLDKIVQMVGEEFSLKTSLNAPADIEAASFRIIESEVDLSHLSPNDRAVIKRMIHASGDLSLAGSIIISEGATEAGLKAIKDGMPIITDVRMVATGISKHYTAICGNEVLCKVDNVAVGDEAKRTGKTRSSIAMRALADSIGGSIVAVGNAPTALYELLSMVENKIAAPALVIGTPVGFVGAAESKEALIKSGLDFITIRGTRGGSALAVAAVNALLKLANEHKKL